MNRRRVRLLTRALVIGGCALLAGCKATPGQRGELGFRLHEDFLSGGVGHQRPMMVGATVWLKVSRLQTQAASTTSAGETTKEGAVEFVAVRSTNPKVMRARMDTSEAVGGRRDVVRLEVLAPGRATLELQAAESDSGQRVLDRIELEAAPPAQAELHHPDPCERDPDTGAALYLTQRHIMLGSTAEDERGRAMIGRALTLERVEPAGALGLWEPKAPVRDYFSVPLTTGDTPGTSVLELDIGGLRRRITVELADPGSIDGAQGAANDEPVRVEESPEMVTIRPSVGGHAICQAPLAPSFVTRTPEVCAIRAREDMAEREGWGARERDEVLARYAYLNDLLLHSVSLELRGPGTCVLEVSYRELPGRTFTVEVPVAP